MSHGDSDRVHWQCATLARGVVVAGRANHVVHRSRRVEFVFSSGRSRRRGDHRTFRLLPDDQPVASLTYLVIFVAACIAGYLALHYGEKAAWKRRAARLRRRDQTSMDDWIHAIPNIPSESIVCCVQLIANTIRVNPRVLRPNDAFENQLSVVDGFFCIVESDDTDECIRDRIEETTGVRPRKGWQTLRDVVEEFSEIRNQRKEGGIIECT
ncbi:hypothetical protein NZK35_11080 [Stieleria sp. ICT_E10.1]|uniref:hypothetical protein n=1 Tax=Stieleria sedimenti TaxID=2976331 RepID=UPI00217FDE98|nr:hypothetical protein [Stieleria sedimenti]MCS7467186.1 hypothetical protein [Stieleria sedimenti]